MLIKATVSRKLIFEIAEYCIIIFLILDCRTIWQRLTNTPSWFNIFLWAGLIFSILVCILAKQEFNKNIINNVGLATLILFIYFAVYSILRPSNIGNFLKFALVAIALYIYIKLCCRNNPQRILRKYRNVMLVIAIVSLFFWLFGSTLEIIPSTGTVHTNWDTVFSKWIPSWYHVYYTTQRSLIFGNYIFRNTAIFTEAPMASFHFSLAFLIEVLLDKNNKRWRIILLTTTILSTLSTTGLFVILFVIVLKFILNNTSKTYLKILMAVGFPVVLYAVITTVLTLFADKMNGESGQARTRDFIEGFEFWLQHPLMGYGYKSEIVGSVGFSNSIIPILTQCGIYIFMFYACFIIISAYKATINRNKNLVIFMIVFLFLFTVTNIAFQHLTLFFIIYFSELYKVDNRNKLINLKNTLQVNCYG